MLNHFGKMLTKKFAVSGPSSLSSSVRNALRGGAAPLPRHASVESNVPGDSDATVSMHLLADALDTLVLRDDSAATFYGCSMGSEVRTSLGLDLHWPC